MSMAGEVPAAVAAAAAAAAAVAAAEAAAVAAAAVAAAAAETGSQRSGKQVQKSTNLHRSRCLCKLNLKQIQPTKSYMYYWY